MSRKIQKNGRRKSATKIAALVDKGGRLDSEVRKHEVTLSEVRKKLKQAGRLDLARKYLEAPTALRDVAGLLWRNEALVAFQEKDDSDEKSKAVSAADFPEKQFTLTRSDSSPWEKFTVKRSDGKSATMTLPAIEVLVEMRLAKFCANIAERLNARARRNNAVFDEKQFYREFMIESWWMFSLEEWACVFPDVALAGDRDFIEQIVKQFGKTPPDWTNDRDIKSIGVFWHGFELLDTADTIPPLKHWSRKAACEFVRFFNGDDKLSLTAYKERKTRLRLHSEKPKLVTWAEYTRKGSDTHRLVCKR